MGARATPWWAGYLTGAAWQPCRRSARHKVDLIKTYEYVGFQPGTTIYYARADTPPGIRSRRTS